MWADGCDPKRTARCCRTDDVGGEAPPAGVQGSDLILATQQDGQAVGGLNHQSEIGRRRGLTIGFARAAGAVTRRLPCTCLRKLNSNFG